MLQTPTGKNQMLMTGADRKLVKVESAQQAAVVFARNSGRPLTGQALGLENGELRTAHLTIFYVRLAQPALY